MKRQPQVGPRKYKRRRKLKPHELELISNRIEDDDNDNLDGVEENFTESDEERDRRKRTPRRPTKRPPPTPVSPKDPLTETYTDLYNSCSSAIENINSIVNSKATPTKVKPKKTKVDQALPSRPKMIHTQKTRVAVETGEDGRVRHKTKTLITRTQPAEIKSATGKRIIYTFKINFVKNALFLFNKSRYRFAIFTISFFLKTNHMF